MEDGKQTNEEETSYLTSSGAEGCEGLPSFYHCRLVGWLPFPFFFLGRASRLAMASMTETRARKKRPCRPPSPRRTGWVSTIGGRRGERARTD